MEIAERIFLQQANGVPVEIGRISLQHLSEKICPDFWVLLRWGQNTYDPNEDCWVLAGSLAIPREGKLLLNGNPAGPADFKPNLELGRYPLFLSFWERGSGAGKCWYCQREDLIITQPDTIAWLCGDAVTNLSLSL